MNTSPPELANKLVAHFLAYSFLGKVFFEQPSVDLLTALKEDSLFAEWPMGNSNATMQKGLDMLRHSCERWNEADFQNIKRDHARLFIGPNRLPAPPWESVYRSEERLLFEAETFQVRAMYRQAGFVIPGDYNQPDDHFGLEMLFVAHLFRLGIAALNTQQWQKLDTVQQWISTFFEKHICQWADAFLMDVKSNAATPYYQGVATLASGCITHTAAQWHVTCEASNVS